MKRLRRIAAMALTAATATVTVLGGTVTATVDDTAWGAPATTKTTGLAEDVTTILTPLDTAWG